MRRALASWVAVVVPAWVVMIVCSLGTPVVFDVWTPYLYWRANPMSLHAVATLARGNYLWGNPRLGHFLSELVTLPPWNAVALPVVELALFYLATSLALGRWASPRRAGDALVLLVVMAMIIGCSREPVAVSSTSHISRVFHAWTSSATTPWMFKPSVESESAPSGSYLLFVRSMLKLSL